MIDAPLSDRLILRFFPNFLYRGKKLQNVADTPVALLHQTTPQTKIWKFMDYLTLKKASILKYLGTIKQLKMIGELNPGNLVFEIISGGSDRTVSPGDIIMLEKKDLSLLAEAPQI